MNTVIYITSLSYSGSTLLDFLLSHHKKILGLGEVFSVLNGKDHSFEKTKDVCSCGVKMDNCIFWSKYKNLISGKELKYIDKYKKILSLANDNNKNIIIDSSKKIASLDYLKILEDKNEIKLKIIFLLKDVRGWAVSSINGDRRSGISPRTYFYYFISWYRSNKYIKKYLKKNNIDFIQIGYEELCFNNELILNKIFNFVEVSKNDFSLNNLPNTHIAFGNRMKKDKDKRKKIVYDSKWINKYWLNLLILFFPHIFSWNKKNVYSNSFSSCIKKDK